MWKCLIDEYDVLLDKAFQAGYYEEMVSLIRNMFGKAIKTNDSLYFVVFTGCLRISKESIFTDLNNLKVHTIKSPKRQDSRVCFYHGMVLGLLRSQGNWLVKSNAETGEGYSDISIQILGRIGSVIELKYADNGNPEVACAEALKQIEIKKYYDESGYGF